MKKNILLVLAVMILVRCGYLDDYSQDMVVVKSVSDLDEVLLGSVYIPSKEEVQDLVGSICQEPRLKYGDFRRTGD